MTFCWTATVRPLRLLSGWVVSWALVRRMSPYPSTKSSSPHAIRAAEPAALGPVQLAALAVLGPPERPALLSAGAVQELAALPAAAVQEPVLAGPAVRAAAQVW